MNPFAGLEPIDLGSLNASAELLRRFDAKYVVPVALLPRLATSFGPGVRALEEGGRRGFLYETTYFDTADLRTYRDHVMDRRRRYKVRHRRYVDAGDEFVEVKLRGLRDMTSKERWRSRLEGGALSAADTALVSGVVERHHGRGIDEPLSRTLVTWFTRSTVFDPVSRERITVDTDISVGAPEGTIVRLSTDHALVEVKSGDPRSHGHRTLAALGLRERSVSKYCVGIALTRDERANEWLPVLRLLAPDNDASGLSSLAR